MARDYLSDFTKLEYLLTSYFRKIGIVHNLETQRSSSLPNARCLLHVIDLNEAPKFVSEQAFKRFQLGERHQPYEDVEALKDLVLLDGLKPVSASTHGKCIQTERIRSDRMSKR